jgi:hypothetical protein
LVAADDGSELALNSKQGERKHAAWQPLHPLITTVPDAVCERIRQIDQQHRPATDKTRTKTMPDQK